MSEKIFSEKNDALLLPSLHNQALNSGVDFDKICGYNPFLKDIFTRLTCSICILIPFEPLECKNCNAIICRQCFEKWDKKECLMRCGAINYDGPSRILRDIINGIFIKCKNLIKGCEQQLRIDRIPIHNSECDYEDVCCPFANCHLIDLRKNIKLHLENCEYNKISCEYCQKLFKKADYKVHIDNECLEYLVYCQQCQKPEKRINLEKHNCVSSLKEEIKELNSLVKNLIDNQEMLKLESSELKKSFEDERKKFNDLKISMSMYINLLKSTFEFEDVKIKPHNYLNPMQIPYIFRFMTSSRSLQITNLSENSFSKILLNINFEIPTSHQSIVVSSKRIFIVGGVNHEKKTYEFDFLNKTLIERAEMNIGRRRHILTELRSGVFIATGGSNTNEEVLKDCEAYIIQKNQWIKISNLNIPRFYHTAFSFNMTQLYVIGGCYNNSSNLVNMNTIEKIDLSYELNGNWEILSIKDINILRPRSRLSYLFITGEKVLLFGGIPDYQAVFYDLTKQEIFFADNQFNIEGRFFFNDRCTWQNESLFISSQSSRCIFNHIYNTWEQREFNEEVN